MGLGSGNANSSIAGASDAALSNPADSQVLTYDGSTNKWKNGAVGDLSPVTSGISWTGTVNASSLTFPGMHRRNITGDVIISAFPQPPATVSGTLSLKIIQSASGPGTYTVQWPSNIYWAKGKSPAVTPSVPGDWTIVHFLWDGLYWTGITQGEYAN